MGRRKASEAVAAEHQCQARENGEELRGFHRLCRARRSGDERFGSVLETSVGGECDDRRCRRGSRAARGAYGLRHSHPSGIPMSEDHDVRAMGLNERDCFRYGRRDIDARLARGQHLGEDFARVRLVVDDLSPPVFVGTKISGITGARSSRFNGALGLIHARRFSRSTSWRSQTPTAAGS